MSLVTILFGQRKERTLDVFKFIQQQALTSCGKWRETGSLFPDSCLVGCLVTDVILMPQRSKMRLSPLLDEIRKLEGEAG